MLQTLRKNSKFIGLAVIAALAIPLAIVLLPSADPSGAAENSATSTSTAPPAPVAPVVYTFDESTQQWVSPGHPPLPVEAPPTPTTDTASVAPAEQPEASAEAEQTALPADASPAPAEPTSAEQAK